MAHLRGLGSSLGSHNLSTARDSPLKGLGADIGIGVWGLGLRGLGLRGLGLRGLGCRGGSKNQ